MIEYYKTTSLLRRIQENSHCIAQLWSVTQQSLFRMYKIEVLGDIIIRDGHHYAAEWVCFGAGGPKSQRDIENLYDDYSPARFDPATHVINGNLELSNKRMAVPYAIYVARGDIILDTRAKDAFDACGGSIYATFAYWNESLSSIRERLGISVSEALQSTICNELYIECFSSLELLLCDLLLSMVYSDSKYYEKAIEYWRLNDNKPRNNIDIEQRVHKSFSELVYHQFDKVERLFFTITKIELPSTNTLKNCLHKRNNIVHRRSFSNLDRMTITDATISDVEALVVTMESFSNELKRKLPSF